MTFLKVVTGILTGSLGMLSDAAHSGIDLLGAGLTFFSVRISGKPADEDHTYGHGKIENLSAFVETGLMVISCIWITYEAIERIFFHPTEVKLSHLALRRAAHLDRRRLLAFSSASEDRPPPRQRRPRGRRPPLRLGHLGDPRRPARPHRHLDRRPLPYPLAALR